jgi:predicted XRE-type DNA-binding protein
MRIDKGSTMGKQFKDLVAKMAPAAQERIAARSNAALLEMNLRELRNKLTDLKQDDIANLLNVTQALVSKFERRKDARISSLYAYVKALGGELEIRVRMPGKKEIRVTQYNEVDKLLEVTSADVPRAVTPTPAAADLSVGFFDLRTSFSEERQWSHPKVAHQPSRKWTAVSVEEGLPA